MSAKELGDPASQVRVADAVEVAPGGVDDLFGLEPADFGFGADSPMQQVRLDTAHGHILLSDPATRDDGLQVLADAAKPAATFGLSHQLRSIEGIRMTSEGVFGLRRR